MLRTVDKLVTCIFKFHIKINYVSHEAKHAYFVEIKKVPVDSIDEKVTNHRITAFREKNP